MSAYGSQKDLSASRLMGSKGDLVTGGACYSRNEVFRAGGNGYDILPDGYQSYTVSRTSMGGMGTGMGAEMSASSLNAIHQRAMRLQDQCQEFLKKSELALQSGGSLADAERFMGMAKDTIDQLKICAVELRQMGQPNDNVVRTLEMCKDQLKGVHKAITGTLQRRRSARGSSGARDEAERAFQDAVGWISQQKRLIETAPWGDDPAALEQQLVSHQKFHSSIQRSAEVERVRDDLSKRGDRGNLHALDQEWDNLQELSFGRTHQLQDLQHIIQEISREIIWVNEREEEELVFDWGDKNINQYIPPKQESYSQLMRALEVKEKDLNKLKTKVDSLLKNKHPAADKIEAYSDTLQTQWSWLLQITKCIDVHLKENAAYSQFFREANETYTNLHKEQETIRKSFTFNKNTSLEELLDLLRGLETEKERIMENKRQVHHLVSRSKNIVRLKARNPEEKCSSTIVVKALCDFKQGQKMICKGDEGILKNNNQRSKWEITGPGGLDMSVPSVCLIIPPPNPLSIGLATKNEQYYESILAIWNQLYINVKSVIAWQYCLLDIRNINSLTIAMIAKMHPDEYRQIIKSLQTHFEEFKKSSQDSQMFADEDKRTIENQYNGAQTYYDQLVVQLPTYTAQQEQIQVQELPQLYIIQQQPQLQQQMQPQLHLQLLPQPQPQAPPPAAALEEETCWIEEEELRTELRKTAEKKTEAKREVARKESTIKKEVVKVSKTEPVKKRVLVSSSSSAFVPVSTSRSLTELHTLRLRLEAVEGALSQHVHICLGENGANDCVLKINQLETVQRDVDSVREEYLRLRERILMELENMDDQDKAQFLRSEVAIVNQRLCSLEGCSSSYLQRLRALRDMLESVVRGEDIVKVYEARLTEKETTSLSPGEVEDYMLVLKDIKAELDQKKDVLASMEAELAMANHWNSQMGGSSHRCDMMLSKYNEQVGLLSDRWRRIHAHTDTRLQDLQLYHPQLLRYKQTSDSLNDWINVTRKRQDELQATRVDGIEAMMDHIANQKALNSEIKANRETVESVLKDNVTCVNSIKDYETDLAAYTSGLETLLNIPIKRTMLMSPSTDLNREATELQTRYMELLTLSGDYYKFLGDLLKHMEELKIRNTRIDLMEEELRLLKQGIEDGNAKNKSLEDAVSRYQLDLSQSQNQLLSIEEVKQSTVLKCNATQDSLDSTQSQLGELRDQVTRLNYMLEEEKRNRRLAEERYSQQQVEYEAALRKRQKELETVSWSKVEVEKSVANKEREIEQLRRQLAEEAEKIKELQREMSKVRSQCIKEVNNLKLSYESQNQISRSDFQRLEAQMEEDVAKLQLHCESAVAERRNLEEELRKHRMLVDEAEERKKRAEDEAHNQRGVIAEEGRRRRDLEDQVEVLMRQRDEESSLYREELDEVMMSLQEKSEELAYFNHSLEEEARRRRTVEEGQGVMEKTVAQLQVKLTSSSVAATQLVECNEELQAIRLELERERKERRRVELKMSSLQGRMKDLQAVRDGLESQVKNLRTASQEEVVRRRQVETELEKSTLAVKEYTSTITTLRRNQDQTNMSEKRGDEERLKMQEVLERTLGQNKTSAERTAQLSAELKVLQQQLLQEKTRVKEANLRNEGLHRTADERARTLKENAVELQRLKELTQSQTTEKQRLEEDLAAAQRDKEELWRSKEGLDDELSSRFSALELQLKASERCNKDYSNLLLELSSEREKLKLETEKIQNQASETTVMTQTLQSQYREIVVERDALLLKRQLSDKDGDRFLRLEEELSRVKLSQEVELRNKQRLQEENERLTRDLDHWKDQYDSKQSLIRQYDTEKERLEREKNDFRSEINRLTRELKELEETYRIKMVGIQKELKEVTVVRQTMETELMRGREPSTLDASDLVFDGVRKSVTANQLLDCGVLDKPTFNQLMMGHRTVPDVSTDKKISLKGTGPIAGVILEGPKGSGSITGPISKITFAEAKKDNILPPDSVDLLLDAQAATGHIIDPRTNQKLTVDEACNQGVVDEEDRERLLAAEAAAVGYNSPGTRKPLSVFQALKKGLIDKNTTLRLLQAQESVGGILDPVFSVFLPKDKAVERDLVDDDIYRALKQRPQLYLDPESEEGITYMSLKRRCKVEPHTGLLLLPITEKVNPSNLVFDGVRKPVTAKQLVDCGVLDKPTYKDLEKGKKTVPEVSADKKVSLKGTGPIAGVIIGDSKGPGSITGPVCKMTFTEAKKENLLPSDTADLLLEAQAATGHIIDPRTNQKLTVDEACNQGVIDEEDRERLLTAEAAAVGYRGPGIRKPLSVFQAMKKGLIDENQTLRLLQAQDSVGGILDPELSVFLPKDTAVERNLIDNDICHSLSQRPELYLDPENEEGVTYMSLKRRCKMEPHTGLLLLPIPERVDPSSLVFDGVRKPVTAKQLVDCGVLDKPTYKDLQKGKKTVPEVSADKKVSLKGTGPIAGVIIGDSKGPGSITGPVYKMTFTEAKKENLLPSDTADLLLEAQAATGHIIDPRTNQKLTVDEACNQGVIDEEDRERLLTAEAAAVGYRGHSIRKLLSVFQAMKKGLIDENQTLRLLQAQDSVGGILDPELSVFLPKDTAVERNLIDTDIYHALNQRPELYLDPESEEGVTYMSLKRRCKMEPHTGLLLLPIPEKVHPSNLVFDGVRKPVTAKQLVDCGVMDKPTYKDLEKGRKTVPNVSADKNINLKGTGPIAGVIAGNQGKMSLSEAKKQMFLSEDCAAILLEAQAATGHIIDPITNQKLTVEEACNRGVVDIRDRDRLLEAEAAATGYNDPSSAKPLSVFEAMKKGVIDRKTGLRLLQAQDSVGGILDPNLSVFLPRHTAVKLNLLDENLSQILNQSPKCYLDPDTEQDSSYGALKKRCRIEPHTGLLLLPVTETEDPSKLIFDGVRKPITAQQLLDCGILDKPTFSQLMKGEKTVAEVSLDKKVFLKGTGSIAGVAAGPLGKMLLSEAKKKLLMPTESADLLLDAQAATGHIIDTSSNQKLTVEEACSRGVVDKRDRDRLLEAEAAAVGYRDPSTAKPLSVFEAIKKGLIDKKTGLRFLQAQLSAGGILDPNLSVFLPKDTAIKKKLLDEDLYNTLSTEPAYYLDPDTDLYTTYGALKNKSKIEYTGLILLPIIERKDPSKLMFEGVRKPVSTQQLLDCGVLDKLTYNQLLKGEKSVQVVSQEKMVYLKGTGPVAGVTTGRQGKMSLSKAKNQKLLSEESADLLLDAQAATGGIIDTFADQKLKVEDACARGIVDIRDRDRLLEAEAAAIGYKIPGSAKCLSVFEAMKQGMIDRKTALRHLQAQESVGGILDPNLSVFFPRDGAIKRNLLDENLSQTLNQRPKCYLDPDTEQDSSYGALKKRCRIEPHTGLLLLPINETEDPSKLIFDGVRKPITAQELLDCGILDKKTFEQLMKREKTVAEVSLDIKVFLKGTGSIAGVAAGPLGKMLLAEAKKKLLMPTESADLLLDAQAATGHIIDTSSNQKLTVEEACSRGVVDKRDRDRLLEAEAAAVGYRDPSTAKPLSVFEAIKKGLIDKKTGLRFLQAQLSAGGILDPNLSVFLPKDTAIKKKLLDEDLYNTLSTEPAYYLDPDTDLYTSYGALKNKSKIEYTGLILLPIIERKDPSKLMFEGVRKPVSTKQLFDCGVLDKLTYNQLLKGEKSVQVVSQEKMVYLKGTGPVAGVVSGRQGKMSLSKAKNQKLLSEDSADLLLDAQAATGGIIDTFADQKLKVEDACARGIVDIRDRDRLLEAEAAAIGYKIPGSAKCLSVFEAMKQGMIDRKTALRHLQAQESVGGILDPNLSVFFPRDGAIKRNLLDENLSQTLNQSPNCYLDPDTEQDSSYGALKKRCRIEPHTGLLLLPINETEDPSKLIFDGVRKPITAQELLDCGILDKKTFEQLMKREKTVAEVSLDIKVFLKGTGSIAGVAAGPLGKMLLAEAKKKLLMPTESADLLLDAQAATGHIIDTSSNQKLTVEEACSRGVVDKRDRDRLLEAEAAAVGYRDPSTAKPLSVFEAIKKGLIDRKTGLRFLQAQLSAGGILDPNLSVFLPKDTAIKKNLLNEDLYNTLSMEPAYYLDPDTDLNTSYGALKNKSKIEYTGLILLPIIERKDPSKLMFEGVRKPVSTQQLLDCGVLDKLTYNQLVKGEKSVQVVSQEKMVYLKGTGPVAGVVSGRLGKMSLSKAKNQKLLSEDSADLLLDAQAATGGIIDTFADQKLKVEDAYARGIVDIRDRDRLLEAEAAAIGYKIPGSAKCLSVFEAMKQGMIDRKTALRHLQAQESVGGILDPNLSVFFPRDGAIKRNLLDENLSQTLNQSPKCYLDPDTEQDSSYGALKKRCRIEAHTGLLLLPINETEDPSKLIFDGVRKPITAQELLDCGILEKKTFEQLIKREKTVAEVSLDIKVFLKGTGSIAGVAAGPLGKMLLSEAKKKLLMPTESADLLLDAQAATGHIIDTSTNQKLTVEEACSRGVVDSRDRDRLLEAEAAAVGYQDPNTTKPLSVYEAMKKGFIDRKTGLRFLQAQLSAGGILDPNLSVFLPKDTAIKKNLLNEDLYNTLSMKPAYYLDPDTDLYTSYGALKNKSKIEYTGLILLPIIERKDPSKLMFEGVRKPVSTQQLLDCGILDKSTYNQLLKGERTVHIVSQEKMVYLKGTEPIAGVTTGRQGKMSLSEAKKQKLLSEDSVNLLLDAQAATGGIIDTQNDGKLKVEDACARGIVDIRDRDRLLEAEAAAVGFNIPDSAKTLSVFEAMNKGMIDRKTALRHLQAQESVGGILDPNLSVFFPRDIAIKRNLLDENLSQTLNQSPKCYLDPDTEQDSSYGALKKRCRIEPHTGLLLLPISETVDPSKLIFDGVRKPVTAQQLLDCGILDEKTFEQLVKGEKTVAEVSLDKKVFLKGTGSIAGVAAGPLGKMLLSEAKKKLLMPTESADLLLDAQAATGHIIDTSSNQKLTVEEACSRGVVDKRDRDRLLEAEAAAVGYQDPNTTKPLSVYEAMKKAFIDRKTGLRFLQAQLSAGGILDPNLSVFLPKDTAIKKNLLDEDLYHTLSMESAYYLDPDTDLYTSYGALKNKSKIEYTGLILLPVPENIDPSTLQFSSIRKMVTAQQLLDCGVLDKLTFDQLLKGTKTVEEVSVDKKVFLKGTGPVAGVAAGPLKKMSFVEAKKKKIMPSYIADMLLVAQAATGYIVDPRTNQKLSVKEAFAKGIIDKEDESKLLAAEAATIGYRDPNTAKLLSVGQAMKKRLISKDTTLRILQAQQSVGGILDPVLGIFLPKDIALNRALIDEELYDALNQSPECYVDPDTQQPTTYISLKKKCKADPNTGLLLLPEPKKPLTVQGLRDEVSVIDLVDANLLEPSDMDRLREGTLTSHDIEDRLRSYLRGSACIAGVYDEDSDKVMPIYQAMKDGLLQSGMTLTLLEAQAASGFIVDPVNNLYLTVSDAYNRRLFGPELQDKLLSAEKAVTGYKLPGTDNTISLFQAIERGLVEKGHGIRLLEAQIASGGIIDPKHSHRIDVNVAYKRGYFDEKMNNSLTGRIADSKGFFDPNTEENLTYLELKKRCITDKKTGLILLPILEKTKKESIMKNTFRKRRVVIIDPATNKEMTVHEAYSKGYIDYDTYVELSEQECEWEEITITDPDGSTRFVIIDRKTGREFDITDLLEKKVISQADFDRYKARDITLTQFADIIRKNAKHGSSAASGTSSVTSSFASRTSASQGMSASRTSAPQGMSASRTSAPQGMSSSSISASQGMSSSSISASQGMSSRSITASEDMSASRTSAPQGQSASRTSASQGMSVSSTSASPNMSSMTSSSALRTSEAPIPSSGASASSSLFGSSVTSASTISRVTTRKSTTVTEHNTAFNTSSEGSPGSFRNLSSVSINLASPVETAAEQQPVGAIFDTDALEKINVTEALNRGLLDSITAQRLLEAQACTGGIVNPRNGQRMGIQEASRLGIINDRMATNLKPAQKAYIGFEDVKTRRKMSLAQAMKETWLPYEAGQRFMEFQFATGGLYDPVMDCRRTIADALKMGWLDERAAHKLQDVSNHTKNLTCPKSKLKISYKEALDNCMVEESTGVKMLQASSVSSRGISSPYNVASAPGSSTGSRSGSHRGSRRGSLDLGSPTSSSTSRYSKTSTTTFLSTR